MNNLSIAIIGMAGRFPGAKNLKAFWQNLRDGVESISFFSDEMLEKAGVYESWVQDPSYVKARGALDDIDLFDAEFFGMNPHEASITDPQHRVFLECAWEALERAGYANEKYRRAVGLFAGTSVSQYLIAQLVLGVSAADDLRLLLGNDKDFLTSRVAYKMNLRGPAVSVQTACSTSLVAVHLACQSLLAGESDIALAGGVSIGVPQVHGYFYDGGINSPDGHCRAFDAEARGTVDGSGVGIVVLKRMGEAVEDGDLIQAVILGTAINNDGSVKVGYTAPSVEGQARVIADALAVADVDPSTISYVEAHGTGTELGDPIEIAALNQAYKARTERRDYCALGSVKTNIGHLDAAAGVAGLIKTVLAMQHGEIPASLHYKEPNPKIDFEDSPFYVNAELKRWRSEEGVRRAGVSSFGIGGTNAHVVVEEAPEREKSGRSRAIQLLTMSARDDEALGRMREELSKHVAENPEEAVADVAYTLNVGRKRFQKRYYVVSGGDRVELQKGLEEGGEQREAKQEGRRTLVYVFSGQGTQYVGMGRELYEKERVFREEVDRCSEMVREEIGVDLREVVFASESRREEAEREINETRITQPALFVIEYALVEMLKSWGLAPSGMIGHSIGELVAASVGGVMGLEESLKVVAARGELMQGMERGGMVAAMLSGEEMEKRLVEGVSVAAENGPEQSVASGSEKAIEEMERRLKEEGIGYKRLKTSHGFHSRLMEEAAKEMVKVMRGVRLKEPEIGIISNVTGKWMSGEEAKDPEYWGRQMRERVRFWEGIKEIVREPGRVVMEIGVSSGAGRTVKQAAEGEGVVVSWTLPREGEGREYERVIRGLGEVWAGGIEVDWKKYYEGEKRKRVALPSYPFHRQRYWFEGGKGARRKQNAKLRAKIANNSPYRLYAPSWRRIPSIQSPPLLSPASSWLIFCDEFGIGAQMAEELKAQGSRVVTVTPDRALALGDSSAIDTRLPAHYDALIGHLKTSNELPERIIHLWSLTDSSSPGPPDFDQTQYAGFYGLLYLAQALEGSGIGSRTRVVVVSNDVQEVTGFEKICPAKTTILAACRVIPQEYPHITFRNIDIDSTHGDALNRTLAAQLIKEAGSDSTDPFIAYRGRHRWAQQFDELPSPESGNGAVLLKQNGVYLINGGLGELGRVLAAHLAGEYAARLALVGRAHFPETRSQRSELQAANQSDSVQFTLDEVSKIEDKGSEVLLLQADVSDEAEMRLALDRVYKHYGQLDGVIHAAGLRRSEVLRSIHETQPDYCSEHFGPKARGAAVLETVLHDYTPDFVVLISSLSSVLGGLGMCAYSAANTFLDGSAIVNNRNGATRWLSINLDGLNLSKSGDNGGLLNASQTIAAFEQSLALLDEPQILVSATDLEMRLSRWIYSRDESELPETKSVQETYARPSHLNAYVEARDDVERRLADIWQNLLGIAPIGIHDNFFDLGGHSLLMTQLVARLRSAMKADLPLASILELPTIEQLAEAIRRMTGSGESETRRSRLVEIQRGGSKPPLFCVHPLGGGVSVFVDLARHLGSDQPFYAFQAADLQTKPEDGSAFTSIEDMAGEYLKELLSVRRQGPYSLAGLSFGGQVAFEMAQQLSARGERVAFLGLLDTFAPNPKAPAPDDNWLLVGYARELAASAGRDINLTTDDLCSGDWKQNLIKVLNRLKSEKVVAQNTDISTMEAFLREVRTRIDISRDYSPKAYAGQITLFRATDIGADLGAWVDIDDPSYGWSRFSDREVKIVDVPGNHATICVPPSVETLALRLASCLEEGVCAIASEAQGMTETTTKAPGKVHTI